nr:general negative regulator of transcription subunit 4 [Quercus suber]
MNGLCPACRRPYNDKDIDYKVITPEETAAHKARQAEKQKKNQAVLQKEKAKAEAQHLSRKHLAGLRVMQKNLVYVTGLSPTSQEDQLLQTLRGDQYFGQYGKIIKIVVSKAKDPSHPHSVGVYVTYERKEDAQSCISAVNGAKNGERTLRAQFGTTKYCSAYLRNETCTNRNCMFLHEAGDGNESYSRADLSALNAGSSQHEGGRPPPPQSQQPVASATQPMVRQASNDALHSPPISRPALPSTASWASKPPFQSHRVESRTTSSAAESPVVVNAVAVPAAEPQREPPSQDPQMLQPKAAVVSSPALYRRARPAAPLINLLRSFSIEDFRFVFSGSSLSEADFNIVKNYPPLFDKSGGAATRLRMQRKEEQSRLERDVLALQQHGSAGEDDSLEMSGSLQLGGEPEERAGLGPTTSTIHPPRKEGVMDQQFQFGGDSSSPGSGDRGITSQQQSQLLLQTIKAPSEQASYLNHSSATQNPILPSGNSAPPGHQRNVSRYSFANDSASATTVKPVANPKLMSQQSSIMPQPGSAQFANQQDQRLAGNNQQFFTSNVQGPPPGLKTSGTPPVSGGMTFGQGHGFATGGLVYGNNVTGRNANEELMRNLLRGRDNSMDTTAKRESHYMSPSNQFHSTTAAAVYPSVGFGAQQFAFDSQDKQRSKKKSKKHGRHGNTSSSVSSANENGGSEHPHMLQARLQQGANVPNGFAGQTAAAGGLYLNNNNNNGLYGSGNFTGGRWCSGDGFTSFGTPRAGLLAGGRSAFCIRDLVDALDWHVLTKIDLESTCTCSFHQRIQRLLSSSPFHTVVCFERDMPCYILPLSSYNWSARKKLCVEIQAAHSLTKRVGNSDIPSMTPSRAGSLSFNDGVASRHGTPPVPPGFENQVNESRRATPTIPPGLSKPNALPNLEDGPISRPGSRASLRRQASIQQIVPALPLRLGTPAARPATPAKIEDSDGKRAIEVETPTKASKTVDGKGKTSLAVDEQTDETLKSAKPESASSEKSKPKHADPATTDEKLSLTSIQNQQLDESPAEDQVPSPRPQAKQSPSPDMGSKGLQASMQKIRAEAPPVTPSKVQKNKNEGSKRKHPGKLDIAAAVPNPEYTGAFESTPVDAATPAKSTESASHDKVPDPGTPGRPSVSRAISQTPSIVSKSNSPGGIASPAVKSVPRTLRVVQTPKAEVPPSQVFTMPTATSRIPSRKPSVASMNLPGTPSSEHVSMSDNVSMTSTSISRANSPPLSKIGSAPVRTKTKSQLKKERQERAKAIVQVEEETKAAAAEEPAQEAIVSRKKKEKKAKETKAKARSSVVVTEPNLAIARPASPVPELQSAVKAEPAAVEISEAHAATSPKPREVSSPPRPPMLAPHEPSPPLTPTLTAASLIAELKSQAPDLQHCIDSLFRSPVNTHFKPTQPISAKDLANPHVWKHDFKIGLTKDEIDALIKGDIPAVHYGGQEGRMWDRGMVTGSGAHLRALTSELEQRFLELEKALREMPEELRFRASKPQNETRFPQIDLEALKRQFDNAGGRGVSVMEQMVQDGSTMKKGAFLVDEASKYVNEFVMPPTPPTPTAQLQGQHMPLPATLNAPSGHGYAGGAHQQASHQQHPSTNSSVPVEQVAVNVDNADRQLAEARRIADEKDSALRKVMKKNRRLLGLAFAGFGVSLSSLRAAAAYRTERYRSYAPQMGKFGRSWVERQTMGMS